ncbi:MAG: TonB-dependent receptor [Chitinophagales bacterium]|nr:TonB-dependent receptor [Chitinophagales bacterium]MDW8428538.1 TonB-dependent receptor [Chitinophagales bacterium]
MKELIFWCCRWLLASWAAGSGCLLAQSTTLIIRSSVTDSVIGGAQVIWESPDGVQQTLYAQPDGTVHMPLRQPTLVRIYKHGFRLYTDSIMPGAILTVHLQPLGRHLEDVVVTGQHRSMPAAHSVLHVRIVERAELDLRQAQDLTDAITYELWARMSRDEVLGSYASINAISGQNLKILINGIPVIGRENGNIDLGQISLQDVERIEIIEGPMSVLYGTDALGGVINLIMREPPDSSGGAECSFYTETIGTYNLAVNGGGNFRGHTFRVSAGRYFFSGFPLQPPQRYQLWKPKLQYFGSLTFRPNVSGWNLRWRSDVLREEIRNKGLPVLTPYQAYAFDDYYYVWRGVQALHASRQLGQGLLWNGQAGLSTYSREKVAYRKDLVKLELHERAEDYQYNRFSELNVRSDVSGVALTKSLSWQVGLDFTGQQAAGNRLQGRQQQYEGALFSTVEYQFTPALSLRPGLRLSYNTYGIPLTPAVHVRYAFSDRMQIRGGLARGFRAPSLKERYLYFFDSNHAIYGNPKLKAEQSVSANVFWLFEYELGSMHMDTELSASYNDIRDQISLALVQPLTQQYTYVNVGQYRVRTVSFRAEGHWKSLHADVGVLIQAVAHALGDSLSTDGFLIAPEFRAQLVWGDAARLLRSALMFRRTAPMPAFSMDAAGVLYEQIAPSYNLMDISFHRMLWDNRVEVYCGINNLWNVQHVPHLSSAAAIHASQQDMAVAVGRHAYLGIRFRAARL